MDMERLFEAGTEKLKSKSKGDLDINDMISKYNEFVTDSINTFTRKADALLTKINEADANCMKHIDDKLRSSIESIKKEVMFIRNGINTERDAIISEINNSLYALTVKADEVTTEFNTLNNKLSGAYNDINKFSITSSEAMEKINTIANSTLLDIRKSQEALQHTIVEEVVKYLIKNIGSIVWSWIKGKVKKVICRFT